MAQLFRCGGSVAGIPIGEKWEFAYTGSVQEWTAPATAMYKFTLCGGAGGHRGQQGGKTLYYKKLIKGQVVYIVVGGNGTQVSVGNAAGTVKTGYNVATSHTYNTAWWSAFVYGSGGGATHIALKAGTLNLFASDTEPILAVAGGGGAGYTFTDTLDGDDSTATNGRAGNDPAITTGVIGHSTINGSACHGSGFYSHNASGTAGYGGAGYVKEESVTYKGVTYNNSLITGEAGTVGSATIECIA